MSACLLITLMLFILATIQAAKISGWRARLGRAGVMDALDGQTRPGVTVVIPMRDEEDGIAQLLQDLHAQRYPHDRLEVLVVDDGSTDRSVAIVEGMQRSWKGLTLISTEGMGKKAAIATGVRHAGNDMIALTDADTCCGPMRLRMISDTMTATQADLLIAPVWTEGTGFLGQLQEYEQAAFLGITMGSALAGTPLMAYGANMAFRKEAFDAVGGYRGDRFASGDDQFLLRSMRMNGKRIEALFTADALVVAQAADSWGAFLQQRLRWAGKMRGDFLAVGALGLIALLWPWVLFAFTIRFSQTATIGQHAFYQIALLLGSWLLWVLPAMTLVRQVCKAMQRPYSTPRAVVALLCFSVYAPVIAILSQVLRPSWKGRKT